MFEDLGLKYIGPVDGHDRASVEHALERAKTFGGPVLVHVLTTKGHGYDIAVANENDQMHQANPFDRTTGDAARGDLMLDEVRDYNEYDCRSTLRLRDWLLELADRPLEELCDEVLARLVPTRSEDDVALVAVRLHPQDRPRPAEAGVRRTPPGVPPPPDGAPSGA